MPHSSVLKVSRIDFDTQESLSGLELSLLLARVKRLETTTPVSGTSIVYIQHAVTDSWSGDVANCIVFSPTSNSTITNAILADTSIIFRFGNNSDYALTMMSGIGNTFTLIPHEFMTVRHIGSTWTYVSGIN